MCNYMLVFIIEAGAQQQSQELLFMYSCFEKILIRTQLKSFMKIYLVIQGLDFDVLCVQCIYYS